eukprot:Mrub_01049.p1 GENE.Mrub_01049~~Mrub_01049.p1  ORF type:complete len:628 (-),score=120.74 Mrub_01049:182-2065(-)
MKINKAEVRNNIIILNTEDSESNYVKMWSKDAAKITMFCDSKPGDLIKVIEWQYLKEHSIVNLKQAELITQNQPTGTQQMNMYANQRGVQPINSVHAMNTNNNTNMTNNSYTMNSVNQNRNMNPNNNMSGMNNYTMNQNQSRPNNYPNNMNNSFNRNQDQMLHESAFSNVAIMPINALSPNCASWRIRAKIESKAPIREWDKGERHFINFFVILADKDGNKIEGTFWSEAVQKYFNVLEEGKVYEFSGGQIKPVQRQWAKTDHSFALSFDVNANITEVQEQIETRLNLKTIDDLNEPNGTVDMLVKVLSHAPKTEIQTKVGPKLIKKVQVADISQKSVELTLWSEFADMLDEKSSELDNKCVIALMGATYRNHATYGKSIGTVGNTKLLINPTHIRSLVPKIHELEKMFQVVDLNNIQPTSAQMQTAELLPIKMYDDLVQEPDRLPEKTNTADIQKYTIVGLHNFVKRPDNYSNRYPWYYACPNTSCNKKVDESANECQHCNTDMSSGGNYKFIQYLALCGPTKQVYMNAYEREYPAIINMSGNDYKRLYDENQDDFNAVIAESLYRPYAMTIKIYRDEYNGETKAKVNIQGTPTRLFECEGGDAVKSFKLMVELNKKADSKIGLKD